MSIIYWIILGIVAGLIATAITRTRSGIVEDLILGVVGALIGGFIMNLFNASGVTGFNIYSLIVAVIGAVVLIAIGKLLSGRNRVH